jgi:hypothetical protein
VKEAREEIGLVDFRRRHVGRRRRRQRRGRLAPRLSLPGRIRLLMEPPKSFERKGRRTEQVLVVPRRRDGFLGPIFLNRFGRNLRNFLFNLSLLLLP